MHLWRLFGSDSVHDSIVYTHIFGVIQFNGLDADIRQL
jgi:hypothetical protein